MNRVFCVLDDRNRLWGCRVYEYEFFLKDEKTNKHIS